jgi:hypothetical protein
MAPTPTRLPSGAMGPVARPFAVMVDPATALPSFAILAAGLMFGGPGVVPAAPMTVVLFVLVRRRYVRYVQYVREVREVHEVHEVREALYTPRAVPCEHRSGD